MLEVGNVPAPVEIFLKIFWYLVALASVLNAHIYRRVFEKQCEDRELARQASSAVRRAALVGAMVFVALGVLQNAGGMQEPVFPLVSPIGGSLFVVLSWLIVIAADVAFVFYLNSLERRTAEEIARVFLANMADGHTALVLFNVFSVIGMIAVLAWHPVIWLMK